MAEDAVDYDLMTLLGIRLRDIPVTIGWDGLATFLRHLPETSATARSRYPELSAFGTMLKQNAILADIYDNLSRLRYAYETVNSKTKPAPPKPYPTPWATEAGSDPTVRKVGSGAIPRSEFWDWYYGDHDDEE